MNMEDKIKRDLLDMKSSHEEVSLESGLQTEATQAANDKDKNSEENSPLITSDEKSLWHSTNKQEKLILADFLSMQFFLCLINAIPGPFFARVVIAKGGTVVQSTAILQTTMLAITVFSFAFGKFQTKLGCKRLLVAGIIFSGFGQFFLGFLEYVDDIGLFIGIAVTLRTMAGIGDAAYTTSSLTIASSRFPKFISKIIGFFQAAGGAAYLIGPLFGGLLYDTGGMVVPFTISGGLVVSRLPITWYIYRDFVNTAPTSENTPFPLKLFLNIYAVMLIVFVASVMGIVAFFDVTVTTYLHGLNFTPTQAGLLVFTSGIGYGFFGATAGYILESRQWLSQTMMVVASVSFASVLLLWYPHQHTAAIFIAAFLCGSFSSISLLPTFEELLLLATKEKPAETPDTEIFSCVSGVWYAAYGFGMFLFPLLGSLTQDFTHSFSQATFCLAMYQYLISTVLGLVLLYHNFMPKVT